MQDFPPQRRRGTVVHLGLMALFLAVCIFSFLYAARETVGPVFILFLLVAVGAFVPLPILAYRLFALRRAVYRLDRDTLTLFWGLRVEELPLGEIEWVRSAYDLTSPLSMPPLSLPGGILGLRRHPDLGLVEFLASEPADILLVATARRVFAISPEEPAEFVREFQRSVELGSLEHVRGRSVLPAFVITRAWENPLARFLWISAAILNLALLVWVSLLVPSLASVRLTFSPTGLPSDPVPAVQLMLLPLISITLSVAGWLAGLFYYRRMQQRVLSFIIWGSSTLLGILFLVSVALTISVSGMN